MFVETLQHLCCPRCEGALKSDAAGSGDLLSGEVACVGCKARFPILAGVLVLVADVGDYLGRHVKGIARRVTDAEIPKAHRMAFAKARRALESEEPEHIEEDLESERVIALYLMTHYLKAAEVISPSPAIAETVARYWDEGPFARIRAELERRRERGALVELGCGPGGLLRALDGCVNGYLGVDDSFASIALARRFALGAGEKGAKGAGFLVPDDLLHGALARQISLKSPSAPPAGADFIVAEIGAEQGALPLKPGRWGLTAALNVIDMMHEPALLPQLQLSLLKKGGLAIQCSPYVWHSEVAAALLEELPDVTDSASAIETLYRSAGFAIEHSQPHVPWLFFKHQRQLEIYSTHLLLARKPAG